MISIKMEVTDKQDPKWLAFLKELKRAKESYVTIGLHEDAGEYPGGPSVVEVGLWNEFGTDTSPERSFLRTAIDKNEEKIGEWREEAITNMMERGWSTQKALEMLGFRIQQLVQRQIQSDVPPPNAKSTVDAKIRDGVATNTLQWTKLMLRSVTYKVVLK